MAQTLFDGLDAIIFQPEDRAIKLCTSMALATGRWMDEKCDNGNFIICQKKISGTGKKKQYGHQPLDFFTAILLILRVFCLK